MVLCGLPGFVALLGGFVSLPSVVACLAGWFCLVCLVLLPVLLGGFVWFAWLCCLSCLLVLCGYPKRFVNTMVPERFVNLIVPERLVNIIVSYACFNVRQETPTHLTSSIHAVIWFKGQWLTKHCACLLFGGGSGGRQSGHGGDQTGPLR